MLHLIGGISRRRTADLVRTAFGAIGAAALVGIVGAPPAAAHTALEGSSPADGARLSAPPDQVELDFSEPVRTQVRRVVVRGPDGRRFELGPSQVASDTVVQPLRPLGAAGEYQIIYRVVADDGHPLAGVVRFTMTRPGSGLGSLSGDSDSVANSIAAAQRAAEGRAAARRGGYDGPSLWALVIGAAVATAIAGGATWFGWRVTRDLDQ
jgi:copper resistance protein C